MTAFLWGKIGISIWLWFEFLIVREVKHCSVVLLYLRTLCLLSMYLRYRNNIYKGTHTVCVPMWWLRICFDMFAEMLSCCVWDRVSVFTAVHAATQSVNFWDFPVSAFHLAWRADSHYWTSFTWALGISNSNPQTYMANTWPLNSLPSPCLFILISLQYFSLVSRNCTLRYSV